MDCHGEQFDTLDSLYELISSISNHQELEEIEGEYLRSIGTLIPAHANAVYLFKPNKPYPVRITATGVDEDFLVYYEEKGRTIDPLRDWIFKNHSPNQSQLLFGLEGWKHHPVYNVVGSAKIDYAMQCPIVSDDHVIGTLNFGRTATDGQFNRTDLKAIKILSQFFSMALARVLRHSNLSRSQDQLCQSIDHGRQGIVIVDRDFTIQYANKSAQRITMSVFNEQPSQELSNLIRLECQNQKNKHRQSKSLSARFCSLPGGTTNQTLIFLDDVISTSAQQLLDELLTERQMDVIRLVELGMNNREIADKLDISVNTVKRHLDNPYYKFNVYSRTELISKVHRLVRL
ncbi:MAG: hypothetical protein GX434_01710 [Peptococcaceae bacterium]|nr:hypothetical protein [Peptococcaceae bacterium]